MFIFQILEWIVNGFLFIIGLPLGIVGAWVLYTLLKGIAHIIQGIYEEISDNY